MNRFRYMAFALAMMLVLSSPMDSFAAKKKKTTKISTDISTDTNIEDLPSGAADEEMGVTEDTKKKDKKKDQKEDATAETTEEQTEATTAAVIRNKTRKTYTQNDIDIIGEAAIVVDLETGEVLYKKNETDKMYPASITKIMTALVALENKDLGDAIHFSKQALRSVEKGSSVLGIKKGERLSLSQSLYAMMLKSANDVAHGIAYDIGGDLEGYAQLMNERADELGCKKTHFVNSSGLPDDDHYTTAEDMALIAKAAYENKTLRKIMNTPKYTLAPTNKYHKKRKIKMGNRMIQKKSDYYYKKCVGGKTGYTIKAGGTLVAYAKIQGRVLCGVVLKSTNSVGTYKDMTSLFKYIDKKQDLSIYGTAASTAKKRVSTTAEEKIIYDKHEASNMEDSSGILAKVVLGVVIVLLLIAIIRIIYVQAVRRKRRKEAERRRRVQARKQKRERERKAMAQRERERLKKEYQDKE